MEADVISVILSLVRNAGEVESDATGAHQPIGFLAESVRRSS